MRGCVVCIATATLLVLAPLSGAAEDKLIGHYKMTLTDEGLKCGGCEGGSKTETGDLEPIEMTIDWERGGEHCHSRIGSVREENARGFGYCNAKVRCFLQLWSGSVGEVELSGRRNAGRHGGANEQGDLRGDANAKLTRIPGAEDAHPAVHSVWKLSGSFQGGIYHTGSTDSWSDSHGATGREMGVAKGSFMVYVYVSLPPELKVDETKKACIVGRGRVYSVGRKRLVGPGEYLYQGDFVMVPPDGEAFVGHYLDAGGTMLLEPGSRLVVVKAGARGPKRSTTDIIYRFIKGLGIFQINKRDGKWCQETPHCILGTIGTRYALKCDSDMTRISMLEGSVRVTDPDGDNGFVLETPNSAAMTDEGCEVTALSAPKLAALNSRIEPYVGPDATAGRQASAIGKLIHCNNRYEGKVTVHITWREMDGSWHKVDWIVPGGAAGLLKIKGEQVLADRVVYWAENEDGALVWRRGLKQKILDISDIEGDTWRFALNPPKQ